MSWKQVKAPNLDPVIYQYGKPLYNWVGWCLAYVQTAFGAGYSGPTALSSWQSTTKGKHADKNVPRGPYIPLWYSGWGSFGHVVIAKFNSNGSGTAWTSPNNAKATYDKISFSNLDDLTAQLQRGWASDIKYLGWSEYVGPTRVVKYEAPVASTNNTGRKTVNEADLTIVYKYGPLGLGGYQPRSRKTKEGSDVYIGKSAEFVIKDHYNSKEAKDKRAALSKNIKELEQEVKRLQEQLATTKPQVVKSDADKKLQAIKDALGIQ